MKNKINKVIVTFVLLLSALIFVLVMRVLFLSITLEYVSEPNLNSIPFVLNIILWIIISLTLLFINSKKGFTVLLVIFSLYFPSFYFSTVNQWWWINTWLWDWWVQLVIIILELSVISSLSWVGSLLTLYIIKRNPKKEKEIYQGLYIFLSLIFLIVISVFYIWF